MSNDTTMNLDDVLAVLDSACAILDAEDYSTTSKGVQKARDAVVALIAERDKLAVRVTELEAGAA